jgi:GT2 family glycosyltransferase
VIIPTRDRAKDLDLLLLTMLDQEYLPFEVIVVDDSHVGSSKEVVNSLCSKFSSRNCELKYVQGTGRGLPAARNLGVKISQGEGILFLDDDTLLDQNVISSLATYLRDNPTALGLQPEVLYPIRSYGNRGVVRNLENSIYKTFMLSYREENKLEVRRSGASVFPNNLAKAISAQRLFGCCCCYRREIFTRLCFDTNLQRWGFMEDLDFSYRVYKRNPQSLFIIPHAKVVHTSSSEAKLPTKLCVDMETTYWFYIFFKDVLEGSILNLVAFLWALTGNAVVCVGGLIIKRKPKTEWWNLIYLLASYSTAFRNLKNILTLKLEFFNKNLNK